MKILYVTTISGTMVFFPEHIKMLQAEGHTVELAADFSRPADSRVEALSCAQHHIPFSRSVCCLDNLKAYFEIKKLIQKEKYDIVHTHTPNASAVVRLACRKMRKKGLRVLYTAHGFHFYKGAPVKNWLLFFSAEWICAHWTDVLVTINREDYRRAKRWMKTVRVEYVPGVGIDTGRFNRPEAGREEMRQNLGIGDDELMLLSVGELNKNKNHETVIHALAGIRDKNIHYVIAGQGDCYHDLQELARKLGIGSRVHLLGYREDVLLLYQCADIYILPSIREGLNVSLMEAMASGLPCIASKIRGNEDLVVDGKGGFLCQISQTDKYTETIKRLADDKGMRLRMGAFNRKRAQIFGNSHVLGKIRNIYSV